MIETISRIIVQDLQVEGMPYSGSPVVHVTKQRFMLIARFRLILQLRAINLLKLYQISNFLRFPRSLN